MTETHYLEYDGHRLAYRIAGKGPALVVLNLYRRREDTIQVQLLSDAFKVVEVAPLGYGRSDRVAGYAGEALADQVLSMLDHHGVDRFVIWGYSAGGAMAACIARETPRAAGVACGGFAFDSLTDGVMRQMERRLPEGHPGRTLWPWVRSFDWAEELMAMSSPLLFYWGAEDRQMAKRLRRMRGQLWRDGIDFAEFECLDHAACGGDEAAREVVIPAVRSWVARRLGGPW
jgi:pimeloyl-ACP methyl ester carboxylesterase